MLIENVQITDFDKKPTIPASGEPKVTSTVKFRGVMTRELAEELDVHRRIYDDGQEVPAPNWSSMNLCPTFEDAKVVLRGLKGTKSLLTIAETKIDNMKVSRGSETLTLTFTARISHSADRESVSSFIEDNAGWVGRLVVNPIQLPLEFEGAENGTAA